MLHTYNPPTGSIFNKDICCDLQTIKDGFMIDMQDRETVLNLLDTIGFSDTFAHLNNSSLEVYKNFISQLDRF